MDYRPLVVPRCHVYTTKKAKEVCGYATIEDVRALYLADAELADFRKRKPLIDLQLKLKDSQVTDLTTAVEAASAAGAVWEARSKELSKQLITLDLKYQKERVKPRWGAWLTWGGAGIVGGALLGFATHAVLVD